MAYLVTIIANRRYKIALKTNDMKKTATELELLYCKVREKEMTFNDFEKAFRKEPKRPKKYWYDMKGIYCTEYCIKKFGIGSGCCSICSENQEYSHEKNFIRCKLMPDGKKKTS